MRTILFAIILGFSGFCFSQDTCITTIKYGNNPSVGKFVKVNGINMYYETYGNPAKQPLFSFHRVSLLADNPTLCNFQHHSSTEKAGCSPSGLAIADPAVPALDYSQKKHNNFAINLNKI